MSFSDTGTNDCSLGSVQCESIFLKTEIKSEPQYLKEEFDDGDSESGLFDTEQEVEKIKEESELIISSGLQPKDLTEKVKTEYNELESNVSPGKKDLDENKSVEPLNFVVALIKKERECTGDDGLSDEKFSEDQNSAGSDTTDSDSDAEEEGTDLHNLRSTPLIIKDGEQNYYSCRECGEKFSRKGVWKGHFYSTHQPDSSSECKESFSEQANLEMNIQIHNGHKPYACTECSKSFTRRGSLKIHMYSHSGYKPFPCQHCEKSFVRKTYLESHMHVHTGLKPYSCTECGKSFTQKRLLKAHISTHSGKNACYSCNTCCRKFSDKSQFENHAMDDVGCRLFICDICHRSYTFKNNLRAHVLSTHSPDHKLHVCTICGKAFSRKSILNNHMYTHKPYICPVYENMFTWESSLNDYVSAHSTEKQCEKLFYCQTCDKSYTWKQYSMNHMNAHSNDNP